MANTYVLDTSVLISDPNCLESFKDSKLIIQINSLNELDKIKTQATQAGKSARVFIRRLDKLSDSANICEEIKLNNNCILQIDATNYDGSELGDPSYVDNKILTCAKFWNNKKKNAVTVVSNDVNMRVRAKALGLQAQKYDRENKNINDLYTGFQTIADDESGTKLKKEKRIDCANTYLDNLLPNEFVYFTTEHGTGISLGRRVHDCIKIVYSHKPWGLSTNNIEQAFAVDLLLDPDVPLVTLSGIAGTGKTLISMACGMEATIQQNQYDDFIIYRPIQPMGNDIGYLPGDLTEKINPYFSAIRDSMNFLTSSRNKKERKNKNRMDWKDGVAQYADKIHMEPLTYIRGRSIPNTFILIDEAQSLSPHEIKGCISRANFGTKIVLNGDIQQIDNNSLDAINNGLTYAVENFKEYDLAGHITLTKGERSPLATLAAEIL